MTFSDPCDVSDEAANEKAFILTAKIEVAAKAIAEADELDIDTEKLGSRQIGRIMSKLRFEKGDEGGTHKKGWKVSQREVGRFVRSLGLSHVENVTTVTERHNVTANEPDTWTEDDAAFKECADCFANVASTESEGGAAF